MEMSPKTVVITGGTRGFGFAAAKALLEAAANVVICSEDLSDVRAAELALGPRERLTGIKCDVTQPLEVEALIEVAIKRYGRIDVFINNAGHEGVFGNTADMPIGRGRRVVSTDVLGTYYGSACALRQFMKQGGGKLINIVGKGVRPHTPHSSLHVAGKAWVSAFTAMMRAEYAPHGVEVGSYDPGLCFSADMHNLLVVIGEERRAAAMGFLTRVFGAPADVPGGELARLALSSRKLPAQGTHARNWIILSRAFRHLVLRQPSPIAARNLVARVIPAETSLLSN